MINLNWPPPYTIRTSSRSKRICLRISTKGLEIVTPKKVSQQKAIAFLNLKQAWVERNWHLTSPSVVIKSLPNEVSLDAINEIWSVKFCIKAINKNNISSNKASKEVIISAENDSSSFTLLKEWLRQKAKIHLQPMLAECSIKYQIPYTSCKIRFQESRWGSCSKLKNISLNCKLLLLPYEIVHYVIVHELVHTIHFNHSTYFWNALEKIIPNYKEIRAALKKLESQLPNWLY